jgi:hypothetical protein
MSANPFSLDPSEYLKIFGHDPVSEDQESPDDVEPDRLGEWRPEDYDVRLDGDPPRSDSAGGGGANKSHAKGET